MKPEISAAKLRALVAEAIAFGETPFRDARSLVIRAISRKQRPRR